MPFQISLISSSRSRGIINWFTAGTDQYATCAPEITLTATVDGNLGGHSVLWEQTGGDTQIVWLTPLNQLQVVFAVIGGGSSDRNFRFYIDKGTPLQQYDEVVTWGTPTDVLPLPILPVSTVYPHIECRNISSSSMSVWYDFPARTVVGSISINPTVGFQLQWVAPSCDTAFLKQTDVVYNNAGVLTPMGTVINGDFNSVPIPDVYGIYYLNVTYTYGYDTYTVQSSRFQNPVSTDGLSAFATDSMDNFSIREESPNVVFYTLLPNIPIDDLTGGFSITAEANVVVDYTRTAPIESIADIQGVPVTAVNTHNVTYFSNNGIGG